MNLQGNGKRQREACEQPGQRLHQYQPRERAEERNPQSLGQELLNEPPPAGAKRHANGHLPVLRIRPGQQQARDVRARDGQNQPDGNQQHGEEDADGLEIAELLRRTDRREY